MGTDHVCPVELVLISIILINPPSEYLGRYPSCHSSSLAKMGTKVMCLRSRNNNSQLWRVCHVSGTIPHLKADVTYFLHHLWDFRISLSLGFNQAQSDIVSLKNSPKSYRRDTEKPGFLQTAPAVVRKKGCELGHLSLSQRSKLHCLVSPLPPPKSPEATL